MHQIQIICCQSDSFGKSAFFLPAGPTLSGFEKKMLVTGERPAFTADMKVSSLCPKLVVL